LDINLPKIYDKRAQIYGAVLVNSAAKPNILTHFKRENVGWYVGYLMGEVRKKGDWAIDISYELVEAQAIPDSDVNGIDRGNVRRETFTADGRGKTNYKGWEFQLLYAFTDKLSTNIIYDISNAENPNIGGRHRYSKLEIDLIMAF
jgi:hypothetical protein